VESLAKSLLHYSSTIRTIRQLFADYSYYSWTIRGLFVLFVDYSRTIRTIRRLFADYSHYSSTIRTIRTVRFTILVLSIAVVCYAFYIYLCSNDFLTCQYFAFGMVTWTCFEIRDILLLILV
jgi:hypothetical protein